MSVDLSKIKPGDEVTLRAHIIPNRHGDGRLWVSINSQQSDPLGFLSYAGPIYPSAIISHTPKALAVGDRVEARGHYGPWTIGHIHQGWAWLLEPDDRGIIVKLSDLERVDAD